MLQSGVATQDLDVRWVSSLSWYFLNLFGLQSVFTFILGDDNGTSPALPYKARALTLYIAANQMAQQMGQLSPTVTANLIQPGQDPDKVFASEAENLEVMEHQWILEGVEDRLLDSLA
jgi:ER membrane protein complex subunit 3